MAGMACRENIVNGHGSGPPMVTASSEAVYNLLVVGALSRSRRNQMRYGLAVPSDCNGFATLDSPQEFC